MTEKPTPAPNDSLDDVLTHAFAMLSRGVADRRSPFRSPAFVTAGLDGAPQVRTVVLRGFEPAVRTLRMHSDRRAEKIAELARDPRAAVHVYDAQGALQLRLAGEAVVSTDDAVADDAWRKTPEGARAVYAGAITPGSPIAAPAEGGVAGPDPRVNFAVIRFTLHELEWLHLKASGHRRAHFSWRGDAPRATWLAP